MKFTIAEWITIQAVICEELVRTSAAINPKPGDIPLDDFEHMQMKHRWNVLNDILTKLLTEEI